MHEHLSNTQMSEELLHNSSEAAQHLAECAACRDEAARLRAALAGWKEQAHAVAERLEGFWARQRRAIAARLAHGVVQSRRLVWAATMAVLMLLATTLVEQWSRQPFPSQWDPDDALLADIERALHSDVPDALAPAALLANEMTRAAEGNANR